MGLGATENIVVEKLGALNRMVTEAKAARLSWRLITRRSRNWETTR